MVCHHRVRSRVLSAVRWVALVVGAASASAQVPNQVAMQVAGAVDPSDATRTNAAAAAAAGATAAPGDYECSPACREGFTCVIRECVSACNPSCGSNEVCLSGGRCVSACNPPCETPSQCSPEGRCFVPDQSRAPRAHACQQGDALAGDGALPAGTKVADNPFAWRRRGLVVVLHAGVRVLGAGTISDECEAIGVGNCAGYGSESEYDEVSPALFGVDVLGHASPGLRLGAALWSVPYVSTKPPNSGSSAKTSHLGWDSSLFGVLEGVVPLGASVALVLRAQVGPTLLVPGGDLSDALDAAAAKCNRSSDSCRVATGPFVGISGGLGVGIGRWWRAGALAARHRIAAVSSADGLDRELQ